MSFDTRELLQDHSQTLHGDYQQALTRKEYLEFRRGRGDDLTVAKQIPIGSFMSVSKLKALMRAAKAESALYGVEVKAVKKRRKQKTNCLGCRNPLDPKFGRKYHKDCRPSTYRRKKPFKLKTYSALIKGKRRKRCAAPDCDVLFYPKSKRQKYHPNCRQTRESRAVPL